MHARRALLYVPGDDRHKIEKALTLGVDCICLDMEDGVAPARKLAARETILTALKELDFGTSEKLVRINPVGSGSEDEELAAILPARPDGIVIPKVESAGQLDRVSERIENVEMVSGWPSGSIRLLVDVETALGILNLKEIANHPRLDAIIFGAEDFSVSIGATRTPQAWEVFHARSAVVIAAAAYGLQAIDMVNIDFKDLKVCAGKLSSALSLVIPANKSSTRTRWSLSSRHSLQTRLPSVMPGVSWLNLKPAWLKAGELSPWMEPNWSTCRW